MNRQKVVSLFADQKPRRSCPCNLLPTISLLCIAFFIGCAFIATDYKERLSRWGMAVTIQDTKSKICEKQCRPSGSETLPKGIIAQTSNLEMRPLYGSPKKKNPKSSNSLLAIAVGVKQKKNVDKMVKKFLASDFTVMLFHYDGIDNGWRDLDWNDQAIHIFATNQTKWWFSKRFLHPDIVSEYSYIFLWDEDLGVENFHPGRYLSIVKEEGLEISQPALDPNKSEVHHQITARGRRSQVHRRIFKNAGGRRCDENSTGPPCTGWVEMMAPVFSKAAWRCAWHMIQNDLIYAWGVDMQLGYCAQGDRTKKVGVVDAEYIVHQGLPTLGRLDANKVCAARSDGQCRTFCRFGERHSTTLDTLQARSEESDHSHQAKNQNHSGASPGSHKMNNRYAVRKQSYVELEIFKKRWKKGS